MAEPDPTPSGDPRAVRPGTDRRDDGPAAPPVDTRHGLAQRTQSLYRAIATQLPNGAAFVVDRDLRYLLAEGGALRAAGFSPSMLEGRTLREALDPDMVALYEPFYRQALAGRPFEHEHDSHGRTYMSHGMPLHDEHGEVWAALAVSYDITERKELERRLQSTDRAKTEFLAMLAHELRNPMALLRNAVALLERGTEDVRRTQAALAMMRRQIAQLGRLVDDLLEMSRIDQGKIVLRATEVALDEVVRVAVETVQPDVERRRQRLLVRLPEPPPVVHADPARLAQVLANLLDNASKYGREEGRIALRAHAHEHGVTITVRDDGIGIEPALLPSVFDLFRQGAEPPRAMPGGLGVGLALVKRLVELHGGSVGAESDGPGQGTTVTVRLPWNTEELIQRNEKA